MLSWLPVHTKIFENFEDVRPTDAFRSSRVLKFSVFDRMSHQVTAADSGGRPGFCVCRCLSLLATQAYYMMLVSSLYRMLGRVLM